MPLINRFDELHSFKKELDYDLANSNEDWFSVFPYDSDIRIKYANEFEGILYDYFSDCEELKESAKKDDIFLAFVFWSMLVAQHEYGNVPNALELFENEYKFDMVDRASRFSDYIMQSRATESFNDRIVSGEYDGGTLERARNIARNETNRLVNGMTHEAMKGLYQKHMWVSENDKKTRKTHRKADGQIVDIDKPFKVGGYEMMFPGDDSLGAPLKEIINCRCMEMFSNDLLEEGIYQEENYDYEKEESHRIRLPESTVKNDNKNNEVFDYKNYLVNKKYINSNEYERKFGLLEKDATLARIIKGISKDMLNHRNGTWYEDLAFVHSKTGEARIRNDYNSKKSVNPSKKMLDMIKKSDKNTIIGIHNHPSNSLPSYADLVVASERGYKYGLVIGHNGTIFKYTILKNFNKNNKVLFDSAIDKFTEEGYSERCKEMFFDGGVRLEVF